MLERWKWIERVECHINTLRRSDLSMYNKKVQAQLSISYPSRTILEVMFVEIEDERLLFTLLLPL